MHYLMVLLLILGVIVLMLAAVLGVSYALGAYMNSRDGTRSDAADKDPCGSAGPTATGTTICLSGSATS